MRSREVVIGLLAAGWLASACSTTTDTIATPTSVAPSDAAGQPGLSASCDASRAQWTVGQRASDDLLERARVSAGATTARFLRPNQPITMEYFGWRLNLGLNEQDVVRSASCG